MKNNFDELQDGAIEPIKNIEWHLSLDGRISNACFNNIFKYQIIVDEMKDLLRIVDPERMSNNVDDFRKKRDEARPLQTKMFYHNKIRDIFRGAECLISNMSPEDEQFFGIKKDDVRELLRKKYDEYEIRTYRKALIKGK